MSTNKKYQALVSKINAMANEKSRGGKSKGRRQRGGGQRGANYNTGAIQNGTSASQVLSGHWRMLSDPCYANLSESAYRGQSGTTMRFTKIRNFVGTTETAFIAAYNPAAAAATATMLLNSAVPYPYSYATDMPGNVFLGTNASAFRCIGFCVDVEYVGTELARAGMIGSATLSCEVITNAVSTNTVDQLAPLIPNVTRTMDGTASCKWVPGASNEDYTKLGDPASVLYDNSKTSLVIYGIGLPAGVQIRLVETAIYEWLPLIGKEISMPAASAGTNPVGAFETLHNAARDDPSFAHSLRGSAMAGFQNRAYGMAHNAGQALAGAAVSYGLDAAGRLLGRASRRGGGRRIQM